MSNAGRRSPRPPGIAGCWSGGELPLFFRVVCHWRLNDFVVPAVGGAQSLKTLLATVYFDRKSGLGRPIGAVFCFWIGIYD